MSIAVTCPSCGTVSHFDEMDRSANAFCRTCDYPLFWARSAQLAVGADVGGEGLRRLPGTGGRVALAMIECPVCTEPNPADGKICIRCGSDLHPEPVIMVEPPLAPVPPPPAPVAVAPPRKAIWPWILVTVLGLLAVVSLVILLATGG